MKKITTLLVLTLTYLTTSAQFTFTKLDGTPIADGTVFTTNTFNTENDKYKFHITNTGTTPLEVKIRPITMINTNGVSFQFCYSGECNDNIILNRAYPEYENPLTPGQNNGNFDYFINTSAGTSTGIKEVVFSIFALGNESNAITFTYRYDPQLSVDSFNSLESMGISIENTLIFNNLNFSTSDKGSLTVVNLNGQNVFSKNYADGNQTIDLSNLSSAVYIANFTNSIGQSSQIKIIKK